MFLGVDGKRFYFWSWKKAKKITSSRQNTMWKMLLLKQLVPHVDKADAEKIDMID